MTIYVTQIGKYKFVCGLFWQSLSRPQDLWREASDLAKKVDANLMVLRKDHTVAQAGYAHTSEAARIGHYSLAAIISKTLALEGALYDGQQQQVHNWLCALKLPDGMWAYFASRDANFLPNGDFAGTKEEVLERLHGDYGLGGWNAVIGDAELEELGFHNFNAKTVESLLPHRKNGQIKIYKWAALRSTKSASPRRLATAIGIGSVLACAVGVLYWKSIKNKELENLRRLDISAKHSNVPQTEAAPPPPHPWKSQPLPREFVKACTSKFGLITPGGWVLEQYTCTANQATYAWSRSGSRVDDLLHEVPKAKIDLSGEQASHAEAMSPASGRDEELIDADALLAVLHSKTQALGASFQVHAAPAVPAKNGLSNQELPPPPWRNLNFKLSLYGMPVIESAALLSQSGVRMDKLTYRDGSWLIEGVIYAK